MNKNQRFVIYTSRSALRPPLCVPVTSNAHTPTKAIWDFTVAWDDQSHMTDKPSGLLPGESMAVHPNDVRASVGPLPYIPKIHIHSEEQLEKDTIPGVGVLRLPAVMNNFTPIILDSTDDLMNFAFTPDTTVVSLNMEWFVNNGVFRRFYAFRHYLNPEKTIWFGALMMVRAGADIVDGEIHFCNGDPNNLIVSPRVMMSDNLALLDYPCSIRFGYHKTNGVFLAGGELTTMPFPSPMPKICAGSVSELFVPYPNAPESHFLNFGILQNIFVERT